MNKKINVPEIARKVGVTTAVADVVVEQMLATLIEEISQKGVAQLRGVGTLRVHVLPGHAVNPKTRAILSLAPVRITFSAHDPLMDAIRKGPLCQKKTDSPAKSS